MAIGEAERERLVRNVWGSVTTLCTSSSLSSATTCSMSWIVISGGKCCSNTGQACAMNQTYKCTLFNACTQKPHMRTHYIYISPIHKLHVRIYIRIYPYSNYTVLFIYIYIIFPTYIPIVTLLHIIFPILFWALPLRGQCACPKALPAHRFASASVLGRLNLQQPGVRSWQNSGTQNVKRKAEHRRYWVISKWYYL